MKSVLLVYDSWLGYGGRVAEAIEQEGGVRIQRLETIRVSRGWRGRFQAFWQAYSEHGPDIKGTAPDPRLYDIVLLCTPTWSWRMSGPIRSYILLHRDRFHSVGFIGIAHWSGGQRIFREMVSLCGRQPLATLSLTYADIREGRHVPRVHAFLHNLDAARP